MSCRQVLGGDRVFLPRYRGNRLPRRPCGLRLRLTKIPPAQFMARALLRWGAAAMSIQSFVRPEAFAPKMVALMGKAFDARRSFRTPANRKSCSKSSPNGSLQRQASVNMIRAATRFACAEAALAGYLGQQD